MKTSSDIFVDRTDIGSSDHCLVWKNFSRGTCRNKAKCRVYKWQVDRLQYKMIRIKYQDELGVHANDFFQTLGDLHQEGVTREELVHRMARKWEKVVDKGATISLDSKLIICGRSVTYS